MYLASMLHLLFMFVILSSVPNLPYTHKYILEITHSLRHPPSLPLLLRTLLTSFCLTHTSIIRSSQSRNMNVYALMTTQLFGV